MINRSYGQVKDALAAIAGNTGMPVTDSRLLGYVNAAVRELMNKGDWPGVVDRWYFRFDETTGLLSLPYRLERLISVTVDDVPKEIRSPWFEFCQYGPGPLRDEELDSQGNVRTRRTAWYDVVVDRGESPVNLDVPVDDGPWALLVQGTVDETVAGENPVINLQGLDPGGNFIRTEVVTDGTSSYYNGEDVEIDDGSQQQTAASFASVTGVVKPLTNGPVILSAWNGITEVVLATYAFDETAPSRRRYFIPALYRGESGVRDRVILARCRRRYVPVAEDDDLLLIGNEVALAEMMIAQYKRSVGAFDEYAAHLGTAIALMKEEAVAHTGRAKVPALTFAKGFPIGDVPGLR